LAADRRGVYQAPQASRARADASNVRPSEGEQMVVDAICDLPGEVFAQ
jgi:hypothetical protein